MRRDSCWVMATRGELSSYERARPPRVNCPNPHTRTHGHTQTHAHTPLLSSSSPSTGAFSLSIRDWDDNKGDHVKHYKIRKLDNGGYYITTRSQFDTVQELVEHYKGSTRKHEQAATLICLRFFFKSKRFLVFPSADVRLCPVVFCPATEALGLFHLILLLPLLPC